jgi:hypothetical protein
MFMNLNVSMSPKKIAGVFHRAASMQSTTPGSALPVFGPVGLELTEEIINRLRVVHFVCSPFGLPSLVLAGHVGLSFRRGFSLPTHPQTESSAQPTKARKFVILYLLICVPRVNAFSYILALLLINTEKMNLFGL